MDIYNIFWREKLIGIVVDYNKGLIDHLRDLNAEINVELLTPNIKQPARCVDCGWLDIMWNGKFNPQTGELECPVQHCGQPLSYGNEEGDS